MCNRTHVPDKLEAFLLQVRHALYDLITLDDCVVSVEAVDDVAIETYSTITAEQTKSSLSEDNPASNKSVAFWKTIYNWCQYILNGDFGSKRYILKYVIVSPHEIKEGAIPQSFSKAHNEEQAKEALKAAIDVLSENGKLKISEKCKPYVEFCFDSGNEQVMLKVIQAMLIETHNNSYDDELMAKFNRQPIPSEYADELLTYMLGWVQNKVHEFTKQNKPAYISSQEYNDELVKETRFRNTRTILSAVSTKPNNSDTNIEVQRLDTYIKQLKLINLDETDVFQAASDFLRMKSETVAWAQKGIVADKSFDEYDATLKRMWKLENANNNFLPFLDDTQRGQNLYNKCNLQVMNYRLQGSDVPEFFGSGRLQKLANEPSDVPEIGWHPDYINLLKVEDDNE